MEILAVTGAPVRLAIWLSLEISELTARELGESNEHSVSEISQDWINHNLFNLKSQKLVLVIQSSADGSIASIVRKLAKALKEKEATEDNRCLNSLDVAVLLLGGARCLNSASATASEVYATGRKISKLFVSLIGIIFTYK